jgi:hypothetical protein
MSNQLGVPEVRQWLTNTPDLATAFARPDVNGDGLSRQELQALADSFGGSFRRLFRKKV